MSAIRFAAVIFDFDGTLLDTFPAIAASWNAAFSPLENRQIPHDEVISHFGVPDEAMMQRAFSQALSEVQKSAAIERYFSAYSQNHEQIVPFEGIVELLQALHEREIPLGLMTGKGRRATEITLEHFGWRKFFASVVTGDDITHQKPHPEGVLRAASELGVEAKSCVYIGDSPADLGAAQAAKMFSVVAGWHAYYHDELRALHSDFWPQTPRELHDFLLR